MNGSKHAVIEFINSHAAQETTLAIRRPEHVSDIYLIRDRIIAFR